MHTSYFLSNAIAYNALVFYTPYRVLTITLKKLSNKEHFNYERGNLGNGTVK